MLRVRQADHDLIRRQAEEAYPKEGCGALVGRLSDAVRVVLEVIRCANVAIDPHTNYSIDPRELIAIQRTARERELEIVGFYHSHPDHAARWSDTDFANAHWIGCSYVITEVQKGRAALTRSFLLTGHTEEDKRFLDEEMVVR